MTRTIWLASYPKSGNTWLRMLIANLSAADGTPADINKPPHRGEIASARAPFDYLTLIDSGLLTHDECDALRPRLYEELAAGALDDEFGTTQPAAPVRFVKVHDAYSLTANGESLLAGARGADGAVVIVRDPRDIAPSLAHHDRCSIDEAIAFMEDGKSAFSNFANLQRAQFRQWLLGWSRHVASWLEQSDIPVCFVRYEDMQQDASAVLRQVLAFAGWPASDEDIRRAVQFADFAELQKQEREKGFREAPRPWKSERFFRRGEVGAWRDELNEEQVARIEAEHGPMMRRLGYALSSTAAMARAG